MRSILAVAAIITALAAANCSESITEPPVVRVDCDPLLLSGYQPVKGIPLGAQTDTVTTGSGLRYILVKRSTAAGRMRAHIGDTVRVHYTAYLLNGTQFATTCTDRVPLRFHTSTGEEGIPQALGEGVTAIFEGDIRRLFIPPRSGYKGLRPPGVPADATLIFDVQLVEVL